MDLGSHSRRSQRQSRYGSRLSFTSIAEAEEYSRDLKYFGREMQPLDRFPGTLYKMVDDPSTDSVISWSQSGNSFVVWNESEFCGDVLLRFFPIRHFSLFVQMLNLLAFRKVEESGHQLEWAHASLVKGKPELSKPGNFVITLPPPVDLEERKKYCKKRVAELVLMQKEREAKKERRRNKRVLKKEKEQEQGKGTEKEKEQEKEKEKEKEQEKEQVQVVELFEQSLIL